MKTERVDSAISNRTMVRDIKRNRNGWNHTTKVAYLYEYMIHLK